MVIWDVVEYCYFHIDKKSRKDLYKLIMEKNLPIAQAKLNTLNGKYFHAFNNYINNEVKEI